MSRARIEEYYNLVDRIVRDVRKLRALAILLHRRLKREKIIGDTPS